MYPELWSFTRNRMSLNEGLRRSSLHFVLSKIQQNSRNYRLLFVFRSVCLNVWSWRFYVNPFESRNGECACPAVWKTMFASEDPDVSSERTERDKIRPRFDASNCLINISEFPSSNLPKVVSFHAILLNIDEIMRWQLISNWETAVAYPPIRFYNRMVFAESEIF